MSVCSADFLSQRCLENGRIAETASLDSAEYPVYDVVRLIGGVPLFWEDHIRRMKTSLAALADDRTPHPAWESISGRLREWVIRAAALEGMIDCNVRILVSPAPLKVITGISPGYYPGKQEVEQGVKAGLARRERRLPGAKLTDPDYRRFVREEILRQQVFEVLLVNPRDGMTEGSRSNVFFIRQGEIWTTPRRLVLPGITRRHVLMACRLSGTPVRERMTYLHELPGIEAAFLSGTSIKVLPLSAIGDRFLNSGSHPVIRKVRRIFDNLVLDALVKSKREGSG